MLRDSPSKFHNVWRERAPIKISFYFTASNELVFINFYAEWCRFSNLLQPIFDEAADKVFVIRLYERCFS